MYVYDIDELQFYEIYPEITFKKCLGIIDTFYSNDGNKKKIYLQKVIM